MFFYFCFLSFCVTILSSTSVAHFLSCTDEIRPPFGFAGVDTPDGFKLECRYSLVFLPIPDIGDFLVRRIDYDSQSIFITDPERCFLRLFKPDKPLWFPFRVKYIPFTFFHCPLNFTITLNGAKLINCLSGSNFTTVAVLTSKLIHFQDVVSPCSHKYLPYVAPMNLLNSSDADLVLFWDFPECATGCREANGECSRSACLTPNSDGVSKRHMIIIIIVVAVLSLPSFTACWLVCTERYRRRDNSPPELETVSVDRALAVSYPTTELGGSMRLPKGGDTKCAICLGDYEPKERVTTIPYCRHFFHSECIGEWLSRNISCPVCRRKPEESTSNFCDTV